MLGLPRDSTLAALLIASASQLVHQPRLIHQADVCAVIEQSITRLGDDIGDRGQVEEAGRSAAGLERLFSLSFKQRGLRFRGPWGRCKMTVPPGSFVSKIDEVRFSAKADFATVSGGWTGGVLLGSGGECYFRKAATNWALIGCVHTWAV